MLSEKFTKAESNMMPSCFVLCQNETDRVNYSARYPRGFERTTGLFSQNVVTAVHIGLNSPAMRRDEQAALRPPDEVGIVSLNWLPIQERAHAPMALFMH